MVTGGASGIGRALATRLARKDRGWRSSTSTGRRRSRRGRASRRHRLGADVGDPGQCEPWWPRWTPRSVPIDIYCSNAGIGTAGGLGDDEAWERSWRVHGLAHLYAAREVMPAMVARGSGALVITASAAGLLMMMQSAPYTVTKHASVAIAEWLAVNYAGPGVQVHCVCPQGVRTPMVSSDPQSESEVASSGRIIEPSEVADAVVDAVRANRFLVLPHPEVHDYEQLKVGDRDRWLAGMRRLRARMTG